MTLKSLIEYVDEIKNNLFRPEIKTVWVNEIEGMIQEQIMLLAPADMIVYDYSIDADTELLVGHPHTKLYYSYLQAMIDFARGEYKEYANSVELFNRWWNEYAAWYSLHIDPASGNASNFGYYLSAYAIAVKHGYTGTEEEWARLLIESAENARLAKEAKEAAERAQTAAEEAARKAQEANLHAPQIIEGIWYVWDAETETYVTTGVSAGGFTPELYSGEYTVIPSKDEVVLDTAEMYLREDVTVEGVQYSSVSNPSGGNTVTIG